MRRRLVLIVGAAVVFAVAAHLFAGDGSVSSRRPELASGFGYVGGRLWANLATDGHEGTALIDTGTSLSVLPEDWLEGRPSNGKMLVQTSFGVHDVERRQVSEVLLAGRPTGGRSLIGGKIAGPIVGLDILLGRKNVLISSFGVLFDVQLSAYQVTSCVPVSFQIADDGSGDRIRSVAFQLLIDGRPEQAFFDTGRGETLYASAEAAKSPSRSFPRLGLSSNSMGERRFELYYVNEGNLRIGNVELPVRYKHFFKDASEQTPFVLGGGILREFSVYIDRVGGRACFVRPGRHGFDDGLRPFEPLANN